MNILQSISQNSKLIAERIRDSKITSCFSSSTKPKTENTLPKKSSSLLIIKDEQQQIQNSLFDYQIMMVKRGSKQSFSNVHSFPGGKLQQQDYVIGQMTNENESNVCAIRETLQETGLYFLDEPVLKSQHILELERIQLEHISKYRKFNNIDILKDSQIIKGRFSDRNLFEFLRLITIPFAPHRYDTQFYVTKLDEVGVINWSQFGEKGINHLHNFEEIELEKNELDRLDWYNPLQALGQFYKGNVIMAPPQFIMLNILSSFLKSAQIITYFRGLAKSSDNSLSENPFFFPYLMTMQKNNQTYHDGKYEKYPFVVLNAGDYQYPIDFMLSQEKDVQLKKELEMKYRNLKTDSRSKNRIYFMDMRQMFLSEYEVEVSLDNLNPSNPFKFLKSYSSINHLISKEQEYKHKFV